MMLFWIQNIPAEVTRDYEGPPPFGLFSTSGRFSQASSSVSGINILLHHLQLLFISYTSNSHLDGAQLPFSGEKVLSGAYEVVL